VVVRRFCAAIAAVLALGAYAPAAARTIVLPERGTIRVLGSASIAAGRPAVADVLKGRAEFSPYAPHALTGWPVDAWLRLRVAAPAGSRWLLQLPETEWAEFYQPDGRGSYRRQTTGTTTAFADRSVASAVPAFSIDFSNAATATYYLHLRYHPDLPFVPALSDWQTAAAATSGERLMEGLFLGVLLTIIALGAYVVVVLRYQATGLFTVYLIALALNEIVTTGLGSQYLWPHYAGDARLAASAANALAFLSFLAFVRALLQTRAMTPRLDAVLLGLFVLQMTLTAVQYAQPLGAALVVPLLAVELAGTVVIFIIAIRRWRQGSRTAAFFTFAFIPAAVGALANIAYDALRPAGFSWAANGVEIGTMIECMMMAAIVLNRINLVHRERQSARSQLSVHAQRNVELRRIALTDPLTGVANRLRFYDELEPALAVARERNELAGVLYVDLDEFKQINDGRGHLAGDELLRAVARRLLAVARESDLVARIGGDEFAMLLRHVPHAAMLETIRERVSQSLESGGIAVSVGVSLYPRDGATADEIVDAADRAMYLTKQSHRATIPQRRATVS
jgi:diguanylate cyclase (GGDEF)-like protein